MFYLLNKKKGISSFATIQNFAKENNINKIGHTGTLDSLATGLLLVATDEDTKLINYVDKGYKTYEVVMLLGKVSDTYDIAGKIIEQHQVKASKEEIIQVIKSYIKTYKQMPPKYSSKKINGQRAYKLARENKEVKLTAVEVDIKTICNIKEIENNVYKFTVEVSRGTYIRSLVFDIGKELGCGAIVIELFRTKIGHLNILQANTQINVWDLLILEKIHINDMTKLLNGLTMRLKHKDGKFALEYKNDVYGIVAISNNVVKPLKLLGNKFKKAGF